MEILLATLDGKEAPPPRWRCHKEVWALKITEVSPQLGGAAILSFERFAPIEAEAGVVRRYMPIAGDYLVIYEPDGFRSISPRGVFEDGYSPIA